MALLRWSKKYSVGVKALDFEHATFLRSLNRLHAAMIQGQGKSVTGPLLSSLSSRARCHFDSEESMMKAANYPGLAEHKQRHVEFALKIDELIAAFEQDGENLSILLLKFMREWLSDHVQKDDKEYGPWLNERGIQ